MANNRFNKPAPEQYQPKEKPKEVVLIFSPCCVCHKPITDGYYGRWGDGGACSKTCDTEMSRRVLGTEIINGKEWL